MIGVAELNEIDEEAAAESGADISSCGTYRYILWRKWDDGAQSLPFIMLNPSTADASEDDPTIRRCIGFAKREGYGGIIVANVFAFRATSPEDMKAADDPVGPQNDDYLRELAELSVIYNKPIVCAWGAHGGEQAQHVMRLLSNHNARCVALGLTASGQPRHPLYMKADAPFIPYPGK